MSPRLLAVLVGAVSLVLPVFSGPALATPAGPAVTSLTGTSGPLAGGTRVVVHGTGFTHASRVYFGSTAAHLLRMPSTHALTVVVPKHKPGRVDLRVVTAADESAVTKADRFTFVAPPAVTKVTAVGTRVTVKGKNFSHVKAVLFGNAKGTKIHVTSSTTVLVTAPAHTPGTVDIHVQTSYGTSKTVKTDHFTYAATTLQTQPIIPTPPAPSPTPGPVVPVPQPTSLVITTTSLPDYPVTGSWSGTLGAGGGTMPYHWTVLGLPNGLRVSDAGVLGGSSYAVAGKRAVVVSVADSGGKTASARLMLTVDAYAGQLYAWGENSQGQRGTGNTDNALTTPRAVTGLGTVVAAVGTSADSYAALADGSVMGWGNNSVGQVVMGSPTTDFTGPVAVPGLSGVTALTTADFTYYALTSDGRVLAWGTGAHGQLGDGSATVQSAPVQVSGLTDAVSIAGASEQAAAVRANGTVVDWGEGPAIDEDTDGPDVLVPTPVAGLTDIVSVAAGGGVFYALHADGTVSSWDFESAPTVMSGLSHVVQLAGDQDNAFALLDDGTIRSWGMTNSGGELGDGTTLQRDDIRTVKGVTGAQAIASIAQSAFAELADGSVMTWGNNGFGDLGNGTEVYEAAPVPATWLDKTKFVGGTVASGYGHESYHGFAIRTVIHAIPINPSPPTVS